MNSLCLKYKEKRKTNKSEVINLSGNIKQERRNKKTKGEPPEVQEQKREAKHKNDNQKYSDGIPPAKGR
jgi:hypothetical protein